MAFTSAEAGKCNVIRVEKVSKDGSFLYWVFVVIDSYGQTYEWNEESSFLNYVAEPTDTEILTYIDSYLQGGSHGSGGGDYSSVAPTQIATAVKPPTSILKSNCTNKVPAGEPNQPGDPQ